MGPKILFRIITFQYGDFAATQIDEGGVDLHNSEQIRCLIRALEMESPVSVERCR